MFIRIPPLLKILKEKSLFLLGPRQTGKSTLLRKIFDNTLYLDLLDPQAFRSLANSPESIIAMARRHLKQHLEFACDYPIIIDEIQRLPELLNVIHLLIEENKNIRFILTGSSARKLRHSGTNLLGGRAALINMHGISSPELKSWPDMHLNWKDIIIKSSLPSILVTNNPKLELQSYIGLYLREEIEMEAKVKQLAEFSRFLNAAAGHNGQQIIFEKIGARAGISAKMAQSWFQIIEDTLIGHLIPTFKETKKREPISSPKFYLFDVGIARFLQGRFDTDVLSDGTDLETYLLQEIIAWRDYFDPMVEISYWRTKTKVEIDFILSKGNVCCAIEIKTSNHLSEHDFSGLKIFAEEKLKGRRILVNPHVFSQDREDGIEVLSVEDFLNDLWNAKLL